MTGIGHTNQKLTTCFVQALCCETVKLTADNGSVAKTKFGSYLGEYTLYNTTLENNGKPVYADAQKNKCLKANSNGNWMIGNCTTLSDENSG